MKDRADRGDGGTSAGGRLYANGLTVEFSLSEFTLDFVQDYGGGDMHPQSRLVTSPTSMAAFRDTIGDALESYESRYGAIPRDRAED